MTENRRTLPGGAFGDKPMPEYQEEVRALKSQEGRTCRHGAPGLLPRLEFTSLLVYLADEPGHHKREFIRSHKDFP
jgi:hypothetical protein